MKKVSTVEFFTCVFFLICGVQSHAQITSTFNTNAESWTMSDINGNTPVTVNYNATGGNPGGYASATITSFQSSYWNSPPKFNGNISYFSYGQELKFDIQINNTPTGHGGYGDVLIGRPAGSWLSYTLPSFPAQAPGWSTFTIKLDESAGWRINGANGPLATKAQILSFLCDVGYIRINGQFSGSTTICGIDNVMVGQRTIQPAPSVTSFTPTSGKAGTTVTITGSNFDPVLTNNIVFFAGLRATITSVTASQLVVTAPEGVSHGPVTVINKTKGLSVVSLENFSPTFQGGGRLIRDSFNSHVDLNTTDALADITVADVDGDGWNDLVMSEVYKQGIGFFRNLGTGGDITTSSFGARQRFLTGGGLTNGAGMVLADLDNDGKLDAVHSTGRDSYTGAFATFRNISTPGTIAFEAVELWDGLSDESPIAVVGDIDGDGLPELVGAEVGSGGGDFWIIQNVSTPGNIEFITSKQYASNSFREASLVDLTGDGKPELVTNTGSTLDIWINSSTPGIISFSSTVQVPVTADLNVEFYDFNNDGKKDFVYGNFYSGDDIKIHLNTNSGGSLTASDFSTQVILRCDLVYANRGVTIADMNGDGKADILANDATNTAVFENIYNGGAFDANAFIPAYPLEGGGSSTYPRKPIASDLNRDGKPELIFGTTNGTPTITILQNRNSQRPKISLNTITPLKGAAGTLVTITGSDFSPNPSDNLVTFGDVHATVVSATEAELIVEVPPGASSSQISVTKNRLTSTYHIPFVPTFSPGVVFNNTHFAPPATFTLTGAAYEIDAADLNLDGKPDVFAHGGSSNSYPFMNTHTSGSISLSSLTIGAGVGSASSPQLRDLDGDGKMEAVGSVGQFRNTSTSTAITFDTYAYVSPGGYYFNDFADMNNDGKIETLGIYVSSVAINENRTTTGAYKTNDPFYTFAASVYLPKPSSNGSVIAADFDKDGFVDVAATNPNTDNVSVWKNNGAFRVAASQFTALTEVTVGDNPIRIYTGDFDVDGKMDILLNYSTGTTATALTILHNQSTAGAISFARFDITLPAVTTLIHISDLDGDGKPDILATSESTDQLFILKNTSTPGTINASSFSAAFQMPVNNPRGVTASDLNLDGKPEIIISSAPNSLLVFENLIPIGPSISITTQPSFTYACEGSTATFAVDATGTTNISYRWQKFDGSVFADLNEGSGYTGTATKTFSINTATTGFAGNGEYRCRINGDDVIEVFSDDAQLTINSLPSPPDAIGETKCVSPSTVTLTATGASNGDYNWYDVPTGGSVLGTNGSFTTPTITSTKTYYVTIEDTFCESERVAVDATIALLSKPVLISSEPIVGGKINICNGESCTLTAPTGFVTYTWSTGESGEQIVVDHPGVYSVIVEKAGGCESPASDPVTVVVNDFPFATITVNGTLLTASSGDSYQWHRNDEAITGETSQTFEFNVLEYGVYAVDVTENGCTTISDEFVYLITGATEFTNQLKIFPNPIRNSLFVETSEQATVELFDITGKKLKALSIQSQDTGQISTNDLPTGIYILKIDAGKSKRFIRISKE